MGIQHSNVWCLKPHIVVGALLCYLFPSLNSFGVFGEKKKKREHTVKNYYCYWRMENFQRVEVVGVWIHINMENDKSIK